MLFGDVFFLYGDFGEDFVSVLVGYEWGYVGGVDEWVEFDKFNFYYVGFGVELV